MKKLLLIGLALGITFGGYSQNKVAHKASVENRTERRTDYTIKRKSKFQPTAVKMKSVKDKMKSGKDIVLDRYEMGKSGNAFSFLVNYQRCLAYDDASNTILGTYRADPATYPDALGSGTTMSHFSTDGGETWTSQITCNPDPNDHALRYPSGIIYNPDGYTNTDDLFTVVAGPSHQGGIWDFTYFGSAQLNNTNHNEYYHAWSELDGNDWARSSMTTNNGMVFHYGQDYTTVGTQGTNQTMKQYIGTTDDPVEGFDWEVIEVTPNWLTDPSDGTSVALYVTWSAWSKDGSIGYMWMSGVTNDSHDYGSYQPQIFYTEDSGENWDEIELDMEDHPTLIEYLPPWEDENGNQGTVRPNFGTSSTGDRSFPGAVDYQGNLHLFAAVHGASTEDVLDPGSGNWVVGDNQGGHIFDFIIDVDGLQDIIFVDSVIAAPAVENAFGTVSWDHRLQVSKSLDEKVFFAVWTDDRDSDDGTLANPDVYAWAYNMETNTSTESINFTEEDLFSGFYFYHYISEYTPLVEGFYNIPFVTSVTPAEFAGGDQDAPVTHTFVRGIGFQEDIFIGIDDHLISRESNFSVTQNQPNPFTGSTSIEVYAKTSNPVIVNVSNIMGQTLYTINAGIINGSKKITLHSNGLESGIYFFTVIVGDERITKKMLVN